MRKNLLLIVLSFLIFFPESEAQWQSTYGPTGFIYQRVECFAQVGTNYFGGTYGDGVWRSTNNSSSDWTKISTSGMGITVRTLFTYGDTLFASIDSKVYKSTNNGSDWTQVNIGTSFILCFATIGNNLFAGGGGFYFSSDVGVTWEPRNILASPAVMSIAVMGSNLFAATVSGVFYSTDFGNNWSPANNGLSSLNVTEVVVSGTNLFAAVNNSSNMEVYFSSNSGSNWTLANNGLPNSVGLDLLVYGSTIFASAYSSGVFLSNDTGANWLDANQGFGTSRTIRCLGVLGTDLFAGFYGYSVKRRPLSQMVTEVESTSNIQPDIFGLAQNYPNPFNPSTRILYQVSSNSHVSLKVYDVLGNEVATLVNEYQPSGSYEMDFVAENLASGIYFYKLHAGTLVETKKMILLR